LNLGFLVGLLLSDLRNQLSRGDPILS
jgi:hypothetical protein